MHFFIDLNSKEYQKSLLSKTNTKSRCCNATYFVPLVEIFMRLGKDHLFFDIM